VAVYVPVKFHKSTSTGGWVIKFCQIFKMAAIRQLELLFGNDGPPTSMLGCRKLVFKFYFNRTYIFEDIAIWIFSKFDLKCLFPLPKLTFLGFSTLKHYWSLSRFPKGTSLRETASYEPLCVETSSAIFGRPYGRAFGTACRLSVMFCIVVKRHILAKNRLKEQIGLPPDTTPRYQVGPPIPPITGIIRY